MRIQYIDNLKGFAILLVIIGHICLGSIWNSVIYSFHMALFFFLSGIVASCKGAFIDYLLKKIRTLLLPFITFALLHALLGGTSLIDILCNNVKDGLWFIFTLFIIQIIDYLIFNIYVRRSKIRYFIISISMFLALAIAKKYTLWDISSILSLSYLAINYPFYLLGRFCKENGTINNYFIQNAFHFRYEYAIQFVAVISYFIVWYFFFFYKFADEFSNMYLRITAIVSLVILFRHFEYSKYNKLFSFLGKETLAIYLLHYFFIRDFPKMLQFTIILSPFIQLLLYSVLAIFIAFISVLFAKILKSNKYLGFFLFGIKIK